MSYEYLVIINADTVPVESSQVAGGAQVNEVIELSWVVVANGADSIANQSLEGILDKQQLFILPEQAHVDLEDEPRLESGFSLYEALREVCAVFSPRSAWNS